MAKARGYSSTTNTTPEQVWFGEKLHFYILELQQSQFVVLGSLLN